MADVKDTEIGGKMFFIHRLNVWKQITFAADLQKELVKPIFGGLDIADGELKREGGNILAGISEALSGDRLEHWVKKILDEGLVAVETADGKAKRLTFSEMGNLFEDPMDVIQLIREVFEHNFLDFFKKLLANTGLDISALPKHP
ncbi:phage tail assembly chaperone [Sodalis endosymbiont of Spalangia cameroni]|uniref:phage tail assembly chaperone n=1 Tax=Sodalis praecaptivus TaxID=1239307 RepID=UPI0031F98A07